MVGSSVGFVRTRVGRRTLAAFLLAALLPAVAVAIVGQSQVRATLTSQASATHLRRTQSAGSMLSDRLTTLASAVSMNAYGVAERPLDVDDSPDEYRHLLSGGALLDMDSADAPLRLRRRVANGREMHWSATATDVWGALDHAYDRDRAGYCVFELRTWRRMHCSPGYGDTVTAHQLRVLAATQRDGAIQLTPRWIVASHDVFLRSTFAAEPWRVVAVESRSAVLAPAGDSASVLMLLLLVGSLTAFAIGHVEVRRSTKPLEALRNATQEVMSGNFEARVAILSNDEYGEVGRAFNAMTEAVGRQVTLMKGLDAVDEVTLRTRRSDAIVDEALERLHESCRSDSITITTLDNDLDDCVTIVHADARSPDVRRTRGQLGGVDRQTLLESDSAQSIVLPLRHDQDLLGVIELGLDSEAAKSEEVVTASRRMADRVALGLANVRFLAQLEALSAGTLLAFARAIDANSRWTAGHSERVTALSVRLGEVLDVDAADLERLQRGGLMHDIGKIGIPAAIIDKAERLTAEEFDIIKRHPEIGEQILKVVPAFRDILCIVRSHHERFDGRGYPDGLAGEAIPFLARIVAVADVYDAMVSDRPYRRGLAPRDVVAIITRDALSHFDPVVVAALQRLERQGALDDMRGLVQHEPDVDFIMGPSETATAPEPEPGAKGTTRGRGSRRRATAAAGTGTPQEPEEARRPSPT